MSKRNWTVDRDCGKDDHENALFIVDENDNNVCDINQDDCANLLVSAPKLVEVCKNALKEIKLIQEADKDIDEMYIPYLTLTTQLEQAIDEAEK